MLHHVRYTTSIQEYLVASPPEQEAFHGRGVRRLSSAEVQMPSGRILAASTDVSARLLSFDFRSPVTRATTYLHVKWKVERFSVTN